MRSASSHCYITRKCVRYPTFLKCIVYVLVNAKVMFSVLQSFNEFLCSSFSVVALRHFTFILVSGGHSLRGKCLRHRLRSSLCLCGVCTSGSVFVVVCSKFLVKTTLSRVLFLFDRVVFIRFQ
jgi:hypothetical protein